MWFQSTQSQLRMAVGQDKAATNQSPENSAFVLGNTFWYFCLWYLKNQINSHLVHLTFFSKTVQFNAILCWLGSYVFTKTFQHMADKKLVYIGLFKVYKYADALNLLMLLIKVINGSIETCYMSDIKKWWFFTKVSVDCQWVSYSFILVAFYVFITNTLVENEV